jgi:putative FmdB family regulatory protein
LPTYEYACTKCGHELEAVQSFSDPALTTCPECKGALRKVYGNIGIAFKGSGFYKTDSRASSSSGNGKKKETADSSSSSPSSSESSSSSSDSSSKSESKADSAKKDKKETAKASTPS